MKSPLSSAARCVRVRDLEHHCRCYIGAYIAELEGKHNGSGQATFGELRAKTWGVLLDQMRGILLQEGIIKRPESAENDEEEFDKSALSSMHLGTAYPGRKAHRAFETSTKAFQKKYRRKKS